MSAVYVLLVVFGMFLVGIRQQLGRIPQSGEDPLLLGALFIGLGLVCAIAFGAALFFAPAPWVWTYHLVLIGFGMTSVCCLPVCIPLLIAWIRPDTKQYFGRP